MLLVVNNAMVSQNAGRVMRLAFVVLFSAMKKEEQMMRMFYGMIFFVLLSNTVAMGIKGLHLFLEQKDGQ